MGCGRDLPLASRATPYPPTPMPCTLLRLLAAWALAGAAAASATGATGGADATEADQGLEALLRTPVYAASKYTQTLAEAPAAVTVLTQGDIRSFGWRTLGEVLNGARGVFTRYDRSYTYLGVRGLNRPGDFSSRLLLLIDGMRANDNIYDSAAVSREFPIDVALIERVEFIPGPGSVIYGPNAVLGVVNVVTRSAASLRGQLLTLSVGSQQARKLHVSAVEELAAGALLLAASAENRPGADLRIPAFDAAGGPGLVRGLDAERDRKLQLRWNSGTLQLGLAVSERAKTIPNAPYGLVFGERAVWTDRMTMLGVQWQQTAADGGTWWLQTGLGVFNYHDAGRYASDGLTTRYRNQGRWWQAELRRTWRAGDRHRLLAGVEVQRNVRQSSRQSTQTPAGQVTTATAADGTRVGVFVTDEVALSPALTWNIGLRADSEPSGGTHFTPRSALVWQPDPAWVGKLLLGQAYRGPNFFERAPTFPGMPRNDRLQREHVHSRELAVDWRPAPRARLSASLFDNRVDNLVEQVADAAGQLVYRNVGRARAQGAELEAEWIAQAGWRLRASWAQQLVRLDHGSEASNAPRALLKLHATTPLPGLPVRLGVELLGTGPRRTLAGSQPGIGSRGMPAGQRLGTQLLTNATAVWDVPGNPWSLAASVYNLGNRQVADPAGPEFLADRVPQDGRVGDIRLTWRF